MDSFTVAPELRGTKGDILAARIEVPILAAMIYGIVEFIRLGWSLDHYFYTYAPVLGGVAASVGLFTYFFIVSVRRKRSWKNLLGRVLIKWPEGSPLPGPQPTNCAQREFFGF